MLRLATLRRAFTLIELLVVLTIVAILAAIILVVTDSVRESARRAACISNLRQIGAGIAAYASENDNRIPYGPSASGTGSGASNFYPSTGCPTSLISLQNGKPVALGLLLEMYLARTPKVLYCPGSDNQLNADKELAKVGKGQAQSSYYYRHGGNTMLYDDPRAALKEPPLNIGALGDNRRGKPIRALVIDTLFLCPNSLSYFDILPVSNHRAKFANILYTDGHVSSARNLKARYTVDVTDPSQIRSSFGKILTAFENADEDP